ncbi:fut-8 [Pristionchus pacificus]|uniref:Fut-8 n=1 Tax=Pristionchus pacificus TaxID=54126 RepID=A0A2A6C9D6_PRIPA|nr:fut-8 [Pristionchus pacificus]|eukprot:PDM74825.1 fut-8 [Pristionchus pacificus]
MRNIVALAIFTWIIALIYFMNNIMYVQKKEGLDEGMIDKLRAALEGIEELKEQNVKLKSLAEEEKKEHTENVRLLNEILHQKKREGKLSEWKEKEREGKEKEEKNEKMKSQLYSSDHEKLRKMLDDRIIEAFFYAKKYVGDNKTDRKSVANHLENQLLSLIGLSYQFSEVDQAEEWRRKSLANLTQHIQTTIDRIQNPSNCSKAKILVCNLDKQCGFGCQLHHVAYCFVVAFGEGRTLVMEGDGKEWRIHFGAPYTGYSHNGWTSTFLPVTSCTVKDVIAGSGPVNWESDRSARVVSLPIVDSLRILPSYLPLSFPSSISDQLIKFHTNPPAFFIAQFLWYLMRSNEELQKQLNEAKEKISFSQGPIVGVQIRRTDKVGTEAAFHSLEEYMEWTEIYFKVEESRQGKKVKRRIFIATDDPSVFKEAKEKYPSYEIFGDEGNANTAQLDRRYTDSSLLGVITDIQLLSHCSHLVCTFSSQVCRMGYELAQVRQNTRGNEFHSLDDVYYFGGQQAHEQVAIEKHVAENDREIDMEVGDLLGIAGNHWDGFSKGTNRRTGKVGLYPSYKVKENWRIVDFPALPPL